jgi:hypothetical protein
MPGRRGAVVVLVVLIVLAAVALVVPLAIVEIVPSGDGPQHLLAAWAVANPDAVSAWVTPRVAGSGTVFTTVLVALLDVVPWRTAYAVGHALLVLTWLFACVALGGALGRPRAGVVVGACTAYSWAFYIGLSSFHVGVSLALFAVALVVASRDRSLGGALALALVLLAAAHAHPMAGAMAGLVVVAVVLARPRDDAHPRGKDIARVIACGVPAAALALWSASGTAQGLASVTIYDDALDRVTVVAWGYLGGPAWRAWPPVLLAVVGIAQGVRSGGVRRGLALAAAAWVLPRDAGGWQHVNERPLLLALTIALLLVDVRPPLSRPRLAIAAVACALLVFAQVTWSVSLHTTFERETTDLRRHLDDAIAVPGAPGPGYRLPVIIAPTEYTLGSELAFFNPFWNLGHLFPLGQGGFVAFSFSSLQAHHLARTPAAPPDPDRIALIGRLPHYEPADREMAFADLVDVARTFDGVIVYEEPADHARWIARGYVPVVQDERLLLATFRGCRARVVNVPPDIDTIASGFAPRTPASVARRHRVPAGATSVDVDGLGCGAAWIACGAHVVEVTTTPSSVASVSCGP